MISGRTIFGLFWLSLAYCAMAVVGLRWSVVPGAGTAIWPASGVAFAALSLFGLRLWPAIVIGRMLTFAIVGTILPLWAELVIAFGTTGAVVLPVWLIERERRMEPDLGNVRDMLWLIIGGAALGSFISAGSGVIALAGAGIAADQALQAGLSWFFGYGVGLLVVAPLLMSWWAGRRTTMRARSWLHLTICITLTAGAAAYLFLNPSNPYLRVWHLFPLLVWAAVGFQVRGATLALSTVSLFAIVGSVLGTGPLSLDTGEMVARTLLTQQFVGMIGATVLLLAAAVEERRDVEAAARLAAIVRSSPEAMISYGPNGRIRSWNHGAELLFGYSADEVVGRGGELLLPPERPDGERGAFGLALEAGGPIYVETQRMSKDGRRIDVAISASPMEEPNGAPLGVAVIMRDNTERQRAALHQKLLIGELNHRVKNTLAVIQGLAQQTFKDVQGAERARGAFEGRLMALAAAHNVLTERRWENAGFRQIVEAALRPFIKADEDRVTIEGPDFMVRPQTAVSFAMVLHELATNAVKYGALRPSGGELNVRWTLSAPEGDFELAWIESNREAVGAPVKDSFGSRLIRRILKSEIGADVRAIYRPDGLQLLIHAAGFASETRPPAEPSPGIAADSSELIPTLTIAS